MPLETLLNDIENWRQLGWMRATEVQFAGFLAGLEPEVSDDVLLAAVLTSHQLGRGHVCLPLAELLAEPMNLLDLPPERPGIDTRVDPDRERKEKRALAALEQHLEALDPAEMEKRMHASTLVATGSGTTPLVYDRGYLYLRRTWQAETDIAAAVADRGEWLEPVVGPSDLGPMIREIFAGPEDQPARLERQEDSEPGGGQTDVDWQQVACAVAARSRLAIITGGPGTGKTWTVVRIIALLQHLQALSSQEPLRIRLAAPTGKAAQRLSESIHQGWKEMVGRASPDGLVAPEKAATLHRLLGSQRHTRHFRHDHLNPLPADVVIVDEASMIDQEMMQSLLDALAPTTRLILLGDKDQLASVEAGAVFGDLCLGAEQADYSPGMAEWIERVSGANLSGRAGQGGFADQRVMLRRNRRSASVINDLAERVNEGDAAGAVDLLQDVSSQELNWLVADEDDDTALRQLALQGGEGAERKGYLHYLDEIDRLRSGLGMMPDQARIDEWAGQCLDAYGHFQLLTALKRGPWGVEGINRKVRQWLAAVNIGGAPAVAAGEWFDGRPVMMKRNDYRTGLMNGDIGLCLAVPVDGENRLRVVFRKEKGRVHYYSPSRITDCETAWAMTVHKSQGSEFTHTVLVLPDQYNRVLTRELVYTGLTRARERFTLVAPNPEVHTSAIEQRTERSSALAERLAG